jgi:hypothetical protein
MAVAVKYSPLEPGADVSKKATASVIKADAFCCHDGGSRLLRNVITFLHYTAAHFK